MSNNAHELSNRLLNALDNNYNVVDMHTVNEIISVLERINITKELLETTRLGKHVNELRRKTTDPTLARRAKVLVKRWRDLVIPTVASPGHTGSNRSSAERQVRNRLGGTPLTSPALSRQVVSPAVNSPRPPSRPAWGGYESDSQDVILVDEDPAPAPLSVPVPLPVPQPATLPPPLTHTLANTCKPLTPPVKRPPSPEPLYDDKKAKRDKKPKKKRGHSRAGSGTEATVAGTGVVPGTGTGTAWSARNGTHERRRNGTHRDAIDSYTALVNRMPPAGAKKVKTTKELLEQIQSRGSKTTTSPVSPRSPASPDVMLIEPTEPCVKASPLRNGGSSPARVVSPPPPASPPRALSPLEEPRDYPPCTCGDTADPTCAAAAGGDVLPRHVHALHHAYLPGVNGTRAPLLPHRFAVRPAEDPARPGLFASIVPLYNYSDYADDFCAKNLSQVPLCTHIPWTEFAPPPPDLPPPPELPPLRPYPVDPVDPDTPEIKQERDPSEERLQVKLEPQVVEAEMVSVPSLEPSDRLKAPLIRADEETVLSEVPATSPAGDQTPPDDQVPDHRTVERTKPTGGGDQLVAACQSVAAALPYDYSELRAAPVLPRAALLCDEALSQALAGVDDVRDALGRPARPDRFAEWHECASLGTLVALPYVVID